MTRPRDRQPKQRHRAKHLQRIAAKNDESPVKAVSHVPRRQQEQQPRQKQRQSCVTKIQRAVRNRVDLPCHCNGLRLRSENDRDARHLVSPEVAKGKCLHPSSWRPGGRGIHLLHRVIARHDPAKDPSALYPDAWNSQPSKPSTPRPATKPPLRSLYAVSAHFLSSIARSPCCRFWLTFFTPPRRVSA